LCVWVSLDDTADALVRKVATLAGDVPAQSPCINMDLAQTRTDPLLVLDSTARAVLREVKMFISVAKCVTMQSRNDGVELILGVVKWPLLRVQ
jgi:hypothetical protein